MIPGITSVQALAARHQIPLNRIGGPIHITTGRQLAKGMMGDDVVVMLDGDCAFKTIKDDVDIYWGAYIGTADEILVSGPLRECGPRDREGPERGAGAPRLDHGHLSAAKELVDRSAAAATSMTAISPTCSRAPSTSPV